MLLDRYIAVAAFRSVAMVAAALTALFSLLEFVEQLASVGEGHYRLVDALVYVLLTVPSRLVQVTPVSMLLGCLLALGGLARHSELTALRTLGISESRVMGSLFKLVIPIIALLFLMAQFVIPPAQQIAQSRRILALSSSSSLRSGDDFWAQRNNQYLNIRHFEYGNVPKDINIYAFAGDGSLTSYIHANRADIQPDGTWLLGDVSRKSVYQSQFRTDYFPSLPWHSFIPPQQIDLLVLPLESISPVALYRYVRDLKQRRQPAMRYEQELWRRVSIPFSIVALIMITAPFVFQPARTQNDGQRLLIGAMIGIVFSLGQQIASHLALLLNLNPAISALAPSLLLMVLAVYLFRRAYR
jgi:lipopolysaccharide export system permease protein